MSSRARTFTKHIYQRGNATYTSYNTQKFDVVILKNAQHTVFLRCYLPDKLVAIVPNHVTDVAPWEECNSVLEYLQEEAYKSIRHPSRLLNTPKHSLYGGHSQFKHR